MACRKDSPLQRLQSIAKYIAKTLYQDCSIFRLINSHAEMIFYSWCGANLTHVLIKALVGQYVREHLPD